MCRFADGRIKPLRRLYLCIIYRSCVGVIFWYDSSYMADIWAAYLVFFVRSVIKQISITGLAAVARLLSYFPGDVRKQEHFDIWIQQQVPASRRNALGVYLQFPHTADCVCVTCNKF